MAHLNYETLLNYMEERLPALERSEVDAHLAAACQPCERRLGLLRRALRRAAEDRTVAPPDHVLRRAVDIPLTHPGSAEVSLWERLVAVLTFDSYQQLSPARTRGAARERQMLFSAEGMDIDLQIKPAAKGYDLFGQVLGTGGSSTFVSLQGNAGRVLTTAETDPSGQFIFRGISAGQYDLSFYLENQEVAVMGIEVANG
jgi:hypothetical protein